MHSRERFSAHSTDRFDAHSKERFIAHSKERFSAHSRDRFSAQQGQVQCTFSAHSREGPQSLGVRPHTPPANKQTPANRAAPS